MRVSLVLAFLLESENTVRFFWQGAPGPKASIDIEARGKHFRIVDALTIKPAPHPAFERMVSIGASFGQGVIAGGFDQDTQIYAPSAQVARQAGAYYPLPLTKRGYIPFIEPADFAGTCNLQGFTRKEIANLNGALAGFRNQEGRLAPSAIRIDPDIAVQNAAVGGEILGSVLHGATHEGDTVLTLLEHLVYDANVDWIGMLSPPHPDNEVDYALSLKPTLWMTVDIDGNDVLPALWASMFDASRMPDDSYFEKNYRELFSRVGKEPYFFIADLPDITLLPDVRVRRKEMLMAGHTTAEVDAALQGVRDRIKRIDEILAQEARPYPNVTIVPFSKRLQEMSEAPVTINGETYSLDNFGGFISLDNLHLTRVGYGEIANLFIESMNKRLGTKIAPVDLDKIAKGDLYAPSKLAPFGLSPANCQ